MANLIKGDAEHFLERELAEDVELAAKQFMAEVRSHFTKSFLPHTMTDLIPLRAACEAMESKLDHLILKIYHAEILG